MGSYSVRSRGKLLSDTDLGEIFGSHRVICQDEMTESVDPEVFQERLWDMFNYAFRHVLTMPQIDRIRWHLFPDIRINPKQLSFFDDLQPSRKPTPVLPNLMRVMDLQQEQLARSLGEGHRVIHGAAGSGKTMILGYRCVHLAGQYDKPILVLCFNVSLAAKLKQMILDKGLVGRVVVRHFHRWCAEQLQLYHVVFPERGEGFPDAMVQQVIVAVGRGQIPAGQYGAVMIDEGHDLKPEWLKLVAQMVDPERVPYSCSTIVRNLSTGNTNSTLQFRESWHSSARADDHSPTEL